MAAQRDTSLAPLMDGVSMITERDLRFFQTRRDCPTVDTLLERFVGRAQQTSRFKSREDGIITIDDSMMEKFGKKMENVAVVPDHCAKFYCRREHMWSGKEAVRQVGVHRAHRLAKGRGRD